ncbi:hypothetical protein ACHWQZ_G006011 [Mnemiopsis leidyi]
MGDEEGETGPRDDTCCGGLCQKRCCLDYGKKRLPVVTWVPHYSVEKGNADLIAGTTVGLMVVPQSLAYAITANLPAVYGLYSAYIGAWTYILFGTSKDVTVGPTSIMSSLVASTADGDVAYAICLSLVAGLYMLILGMLEFGWVMWLISYPTLAGFTSAAAIKIAAGEIGDLVGIKDWDTDFIDVCIDIFTKYNQIRWTDALLGFTCLAILFLLWLLQKISAIRYNLELQEGGRTPMYFFWRSLWYVGLMRNIIVVLGAALLDYCLYVDDDTPFIVIGYIQPGLQSLDISVFQKFHDQWASLLINGLVIALIGLLEGLAIAKSFSKKNKYEVNNSQEMIALGMCNIAGSFFQCYPVTGSFSRSSVNSESGVRTQFGGFWTGLIVVLCLLFLTVFFSYIPLAALAAVIIFAVVFMINFCIPVEMWRVRKLGAVSWIVTFSCVLLLGIEYGIIVGVVFDLLLVVARNLRPDTHVHDMGGGVILVEVDSGWNYLSVNFVKERVEEALYWERKKFFFSQSTTVNAIILDTSKFGELDITALESLKGIQDDCRSEKILLFSVGLSEELCEDSQSFGIAIPNFKTADEAVRAAKREVGLAMAIQERIDQHESRGDGKKKYGTFAEDQESVNSQSLTMRTAGTHVLDEEEEEGVRGENNKSD